MKKIAGIVAVCFFGLFVSEGPLFSELFFHKNWPDYRLLAGSSTRKIVMEIVNDSEATSSEYKDFFQLFSKELREELKSFLRNYSGEISLSYRIFVIELIRSVDVGDKRIFVLLDLGDDETAVIHWQKISRLKRAEDVETFVKESVQCFFKILFRDLRQEKKERDKKMIFRPPIRVSL